ncbi:hypothetical protein JCM14469_26740 [Desulfatiferula olefinivorans]
MNQNMPTPSPAPSLVAISNGRPTTTSLSVASVFDKSHKNVMRDIESLCCSSEFFRLNFEPKIYKARKGNGAGYLSNEAMYELTRDGLVFVVMGYTGPKAAAIKERYIAEFNRMEDLLRGPKVQVYTPIGKVQSDVARHFRATLSIAKNAGIRGPQAIIRANHITKLETGRNCLEMLGVKALPAPGNEQDFVPSDLGKKLGGISGRSVNALLERKGFQKAFRTHSGKIQWVPTEQGKKYSAIKESERRHCSGTCQQVFWRESVLEHLAE